MWDVVAKKQVFEAPSESESAPPFTFSPDGRFFAIVTGRNKAEVFETATGHSVAECRHEGAVTAIAFNRTGTLLATGGEDNMVRSWAWPGGRPSRHFEHEGALRYVGFSAGDKYLATATEDNSAMVWNLSTGRLLQRIGYRKEGEEAPEDIGQPVFSADFRHLVFASGTTLNAWLWKPEDLVADACSSLTRNLTPKEWGSYSKSERYEKTCPDLP
jgi:WD40 repeat protein